MTIDRDGILNMDNNAPVWRLFLYKPLDLSETGVSGITIVPVGKLDNIRLTSRSDKGEADFIVSNPEVYKSLITCLKRGHNTINMKLKIRFEDSS